MDGTFGTVLIIEPDFKQREIVALEIRSYGYEPVTVASGKEALSAIALQSVNVVMAHLHMKGMDGIRFLAEVRRAGLRTPMILFMETADRSAIAQGLQLKMVDFLEKHCPPSVLRACLKNAVEADSIFKSLETNLTAICKAAALSPSRTRDLLSLQTRTIGPILEARMPLKKSA